ncbi:hypothetical protein C8J56DRAFT_1157143 [Mycena floridula]|nr:hypothetical protein C8J56DRAFT_1157143 [Mycena floridula]
MAFVMLLSSSFHPQRIDYPLVLTSKVGEYADICSFGSNYGMKRMMSPLDIERMQEKFGVKDEELKWWIDNDKWHWVINRLKAADSTDSITPGLPPALLPALDQNKDDKYLPTILIPRCLHQNLLPPRLHWGFELATERIQEILVKNGYPMDTDSERQRNMAIITFSMKLGGACYPGNIEFPCMLMGQRGVLTSLVSFGNNYELGKLMKSSQIKAMQEKFGIREDELKWWIDGK